MSVSDMDHGYTVPGLFDLPADHPLRQNWNVQQQHVLNKLDRVERLCNTIMQGMHHIMPALDDLTNAVSETIDEMDIVVKQMAAHPQVQQDGALASLTQKLRNATAALKGAVADANDQSAVPSSGTVAATGSPVAGPSITSAPEVGSTGTVDTTGMVVAGASPTDTSSTLAETRPDAGTGPGTLGTVGSVESAPKVDTGAPAGQGPQTTRRTP